MKIFDDTDFILQDIRHVSIVHKVPSSRTLFHTYALEARLKNGNWIGEIALANSEEELKVWWDITGSSASIVSEHEL